MIHILNVTSTPYSLIGGTHETFWKIKSWKYHVLDSDWTQCILTRYKLVFTLEIRILNF